MTFGDHVLAFNRSLKVRFALPAATEVLNPFADTAAREACRRFYGTFYADSRPRTFLFGINPGRFGAGITGIPFTDPVRLKADCGIDHPFRLVPELSSTYVYDVIRRYGGVRAFYRDIYITAVFPLGFTRHGRNLNYYDDRDLLEACRPAAARYIGRQVAFGARTGTCYCWGRGKNLAVLTSLNEAHGWFDRVVALPHPRWVMQYRRKEAAAFARACVAALRG